jgi:hypothetical protein
MASPVHFDLSVFELIARLSVVLIALALIWLGAVRMPTSASNRYATGAALSVLVVVWVLVAHSLARAGIYVATSDRVVPWVLVGLLVPILVVAVGMFMWRGAAKLVASIPLPALVAAQVYRVAGVIFVLHWMAGDLPWQFALPAGIGDIATGIVAIPIALRLKRAAAGAARAARFWCLFGIADLVVAVALGGLTSPGRAHLLALSDPNRLITAYPLVMIPTFAVPLALMLHIAVLSRLGGISDPGHAAVDEHYASQLG